MRKKFNANFRQGLALLVVMAFVILLAGCGGDSGGGGVDTAGLEYNTAYKWQVEAVDTNGAKTSGPQWTFTTDTGRESTIEGPVDEDMARKIAMTHIEKEKSRKEIKDIYKSSFDKLGPDPIKEIKNLYDEKGKILAYVVSLNPTGYIIVPSNSAFSPVIAYSFTGDFSWEDTPQNILLPMLRHDMKYRFEALEKGLIEKNTRAQSSKMWLDYLSGNFSEKEGVKAVWGPLFTFTTWNQDSPYNDNCPMDPVTSQRCIVGCLATSMAQILNYHKQPTSLTLTSADNYTTATRNIAIDATTASFSNINYNNSLPSNTVKAQVSFACGVLVQMDYTSALSSGYLVRSEDAFKNRLGYSQAVYDGGEFPRTTVINDIKLGRPVILAIFSPSDGHAINVDGYDDSNGKFHMNMGWGGTSDGWYEIPGGMPAGFTSVNGCTHSIYYTGPVPADPSNLNATATGTQQINLTWTDNANNENGYDVERREGTGGSYAVVAQLNANSTSYGDTGLNPGTTYYYRVRAYNASGYSGYSNAVSATTQSGPGQPSNPSPADNETGVSVYKTLTWAQSQNAATYNIYLWKATGTKPSSPTASNLVENQYKP